MALRSALINVMVRAVEKAGKSLLRDFGEVEQLQVSRKGPGDFVTNADHKSEAILREELSRARPEFGFLMEEGGVVNEGAAERWIIDPLDGTKNFMHGLPLWAITVAAERDGEVLAGVTYDPIADQLFWAERGVGAFVNNQRLRVSARSDVSDALVCHALSLTDKNKLDTEKNSAHLLDSISGARRLGSTALSLAYTAAGRFDAYAGRTYHFWDVAAGLLMIREAGGRVSSIGSQNDPLKSELILASNYHLHQPLLDLMKS